MALTEKSAEIRAGFEDKDSGIDRDSADLHPSDLYSRGCASSRE
jgi:hypothetical protein